MSESSERTVNSDRTPSTPSPRRPDIVIRLPELEILAEPKPTPRP